MLRIIKFEKEINYGLKMITSSDKLWNLVRDYATDCSWNAGKSLANAMNNNMFTEWERIR